CGVIKNQNSFYNNFLQIKLSKLKHITNSSNKNQIIVQDIPPEKTIDYQQIKLKNIFLLMI
ncbi:MAG: hypothetical protein D6799_04425, partial [Bacteroidetes bacterium]